MMPKSYYFRQGAAKAKETPVLATELNHYSNERPVSMKSSHIPSYIRFDQNLSFEKFKDFLSSKAPYESKNLFTGKSHNGTLLMHRLSTKADTKLARLGHFFRLGSERNKVRQEIKALLGKQGIELNAEIRKSLPSRFSNGNATDLLKAINSAPHGFPTENFDD